MDYLNQAERAALLDDLKQMKFNRAKFKLLRLDPKGRLLYYRNVQQSGEWHTKIVLAGMGTAVTLVEVNHAENNQARNRQRFDFVNVIVEPTPDNRS